MVNKFPEIIITDNEVFKDSRGYFLEVWNKLNFITTEEDVVGDFYQTNVSFSVKNTLRGIHFQQFPYEQGKLIQVLSGRIYDVAVDLRLNSKTYGQWAGIELDVNRQLFLPKGFGHAFLALEDSLVLYNVTNPYNKEAEKTIIWDDRDINIEWPAENIKNLIISDKDKNGIRFKGLQWI
jgi:dTDP-4-dehydrorhamnose 3,5-epimerase